MTYEIKFADTVILVDVAYVDRVAGDLSKHFGDVVGRKLPKADLPVLLDVCHWIVEYPWGRMQFRYYLFMTRKVRNGCFSAVGFGKGIK